MEPELSIGGHGLIFDWKRQASRFIDKYQDIEDLVVQVDESIQRQNSRDGARGHSHTGLPRPNFAPPPTPRINQLYWPSGASRWARGYFLADSPTAVALKGMCGTELDFVASTDVNKVTTKLYVLPPHRVSTSNSQIDVTLYIIPVVDARYWWQFKNIGDFGGPVDVKSWSGLFSQISTQLGVSFSHDGVDSSYLKPDPDEFTRRYDNIATLLDAASHSVGQRVVRLLNGNVRSLNWNSSATSLENNFSSSSWMLIAGDEYDNKPVPAKVTVAFPKLMGGVRECGDTFYTVDGESSGNKCTTSSTIKMIHNTAWAAFCQIIQSSNGQNSTAVAFLNEAELKALGKSIAKDYYSSLDKAYDYTFLGINAWEMGGYDDHVLWSFGTEMKEACNEVIADIKDDEVDARLQESHERICITRVQSASWNFGVDQALEQGDEIFRLPRGVLPVEIKAGECLEPGKSAIAHHLDYDAKSKQWVKNACQIVVNDSFFRTYGLPGERLWVRQGCETYPDHWWETVGEYGVKRRAKALENIAKGQTGDVQVYYNKETGPNASCIPTGFGCLLNVCNTWDGADLVTQGEEIYIFFFERKWHILPQAKKSESATIVFHLTADRSREQDSSQRYFGKASAIIQDLVGDPVARIGSTVTVIFGDRRWLGAVNGCEGIADYVAPRVSKSGSPGEQQESGKWIVKECQELSAGFWFKTLANRDPDAKNEDVKVEILTDSIQTGSQGKDQYIAFGNADFPVRQWRDNNKIICTGKSLWFWTATFGWELLSHNCSAGCVPVKPTGVPDPPFALGITPQGFEVSGCESDPQGPAKALTVRYVDLTYPTMLKGAIGYALLDVQYENTSSNSTMHYKVGESDQRSPIITVVTEKFCGNEDTVGKSPSVRFPYPFGQKPEEKSIGGFNTFCLASVKGPTDFIWSHEGRKWEILQTKHIKKKLGSTIKKNECAIDLLGREYWVMTCKDEDKIISTVPFVQHSVIDECLRIGCDSSGDLSIEAHFLELCVLDVTGGRWEACICVTTCDGADCSPGTTAMAQQMLADERRKEPGFTIVTQPPLT